MFTNHNFRRERRAEAVSNRGPSAYQPTALPLGQTGSLGGWTWASVAYSPCGLCGHKATLQLQQKHTSSDDLSTGLLLFLREEG